MSLGVVWYSGGHEPLRKCSICKKKTLTWATEEGLTYCKWCGEEELARRQPLPLGDRWPKDTEKLYV